MHLKQWITLLPTVFLLCSGVQAQSKEKLDIKFGKVTAADFDLSKATYDSGANAVVIADIGNSSFEGNNKGDVSIVFTRIMRVKILNKNGFDIADFRIALYHNSGGDAEKLSSLKASTFNLENGSVVETKLDDKSIFDEKYSRNVNVRKFTLPALKEGSIFDVTYTIRSDFYTRLHPWQFQGAYPRLWSEYTVTIPYMFSYVVHTKGDEQFAVDDTKKTYQTLTLRENNGTAADETFSVSGDATQHRWVKKNVPAIKEEPYTTCVDNYISEVSFQLHYIQVNATSERHDYLSTWYIASKKLLDDDQFGHALDKDNHWMADEMKGLTASCNSTEDKIRKIFCFVRDNFNCTDYDALYAQNSLKDVYKSRSGNVAEINLLLTAMLRHENIIADPAILSTRDNGIADQGYPLIDQFNYVICVAWNEGKMIRLDAARPYNGFGNVSEECYNGYARIINEERPYLVDFDADSAQETKITSVFLVNDDKGKCTGSFQSILGAVESYKLREEVKKTSEKDYFKKVQTNYGSDLTIESPGIDSLKSLDNPAIVRYDLDLKDMFTTDVVYFNPMLAEVYKTNPFKSMERHYPVEMPYKMEETYVLSMDIPKGYQVDEMPKSARVAYNETEGMFEYLIQKGPSNIQMRVHIKFNKAVFLTEEYATLRDFFGYVVKKENEQIVFKKIP